MCGECIDVFLIFLSKSLNTQNYVVIKYLENLLMCSGCIFSYKKSC